MIAPPTGQVYPAGTIDRAGHTLAIRSARRQAVPEATLPLNQQNHSQECGILLPFCIEMSGAPSDSGNVWVQAEVLGNRSCHTFRISKRICGNKLRAAISVESWPARAL